MAEVAPMGLSYYIHEVKPPRQLQAHSSLLLKKVIYGCLYRSIELMRKKNACAKIKERMKKKDNMPLVGLFLKTGALPTLGSTASAAWGNQSFL